MHKAYKVSDLVAILFVDMIDCLGCNSSMRNKAATFILLAGLLASACTSISHSTLTDWARLVEARPTTLIPHLWTAGDEYGAVEVLRGSEWDQVLKGSPMTVYVLSGEQQILARFNSRLALIEKGGLVWQQKLGESVDLLPRPESGGVTLVSYPPERYRVKLLDLSGKLAEEYELPREPECSGFIGFVGDLPALWCTGYLVLKPEGLEKISYDRARQNPVLVPWFHGYVQDHAFEYFLANDDRSKGTIRRF